MSAGLFALPHMHRARPEPGEDRRGAAWLGALGLLSAGLAALATGLLHPAVAAELEHPFFTAAGLLGDSARLEGLISALWLLPDLTLAGLLARAWGEGFRPALGVLAALGLALTGAAGLLPAALPLGCAILAVLTAVFPAGGNK